MAFDEWQKRVTQEAAQTMGAWLEGRKGLHRPIASLTMAELEAMASNAISRFVVLGSQRLQAEPDASPDLSWLLAG